MSEVGHDCLVIKRTIGWSNIRRATKPIFELGVISRGISIRKWLVAWEQTVPSDVVRNQFGVK